MHLRRGIGMALLTIGGFFPYRLSHSRLWTVISLSDYPILSLFVIPLILCGLLLLTRPTLLEQSHPLKGIGMVVSALFIMFVLGTGQGFVGLDHTGRVISQGDPELLKMHYALLSSMIILIFLPTALWFSLTTLIQRQRQVTAS